MSPILGGPEPTVIEVVDPELAALRGLRADLQRLRSEPGHITKAEVDAVLARCEERLRA